MDIIHCLDDNYVPMCAVAIESLCQNNLSEIINYHIISTSLSDQSKKDLEQVAKKYNTTITFYDVDKSLLKDCVVRDGDHVSLAAYLRILIPRILNSDVKEALYLDCDLVVCGNISGVFDINLENFALAAVLDGTTEDIRTYNRLCYKPEEGYFNTGVLLFNLDYWRNRNLTKDIFDFICKYPERLLWWDQDAINGVLHGKIARLDFKYNMIDAFYQKEPMLRQEFLNEINPSLLNPVVLHFATSQKPWLSYDNPHPLKNEFYKYLSCTKWENAYPLKQSLKRSILNFIEKHIGLSIDKVKPSRYLSDKDLTMS